MPEKEITEIDSGKKAAIKPEPVKVSTLGDNMAFLQNAATVFEKVTDKKYTAFINALNCSVESGYAMDAELHKAALRQVNVDMLNATTQNKHAEKALLGEMRKVLFEMMKKPDLFNDPSKIAIS